MMQPKKTKKADLENKKTTLFLIGLVVALSFALFAFEWKRPVQKTVVVAGTGNFDLPEDLVIPSTPAEKMKPEKPIVKVPVFEVIKDEFDIKDEFVWQGEEPEEPVLIDFNTIFTAEKDEAEVNIDNILDRAEIMPEFPGGDAALLNYLSRNVKYPLIAQENRIEGKVFVSFVIDEKGNIFNVTLARGVDTSLDREALRVVKSMPVWKPGRQGNRAVKVRYTVPINFMLQ
ncbi:energy transducer TonB [Draconibacterium sp. IB214405]|uniref:energy transducer TonB n=1 Tax=Draconibacterium sp. IB214405 TaxID=3097352 RepID=UPI002A168887|nr:energy transducer TonB [Draconibacterium sp. IB214405]MDX8341343.1 energy transducer TonB [Draconibacterium sp. IB214405]